MRRFGDREHLAYIDASIRRIEASGVADRGPEALAADPDLRAATLYRLQTMAESTQRLSDGFKEEHPEIPWRDVAAFRNRLAHGYMDVDLGVVCDVARHDLAPLGQVVRQELALDRRHQVAPPAVTDGLGWGL